MTGRNHLPKGLETRRAIVVVLMQSDAAADLERLISQAVPVLEQQQLLVRKILQLDVRSPASG